MQVDNNINTKIDLYLTEISIELLGNKIYDVNGKRQHRLIELFKAVPEEKSEEQLENANDIMCNLGYDQDLINDEESITSLLEDQLDFTLVDANINEEVNKSIISFLRKYKSDQERLIKEVSEMHVRAIVEQKNLTTKFNKSRQIAVNSASTYDAKSAACEKHYDHERDQLLKSCSDIQRLIKYILNDTENEVERGELIGFIHAIRTIKSCENRRNSSQRVNKPYKK